MRPGIDYIGIGVGAIVFDPQRTHVFMARRGVAARNERERWEFPGGGVRFGERLDRAIAREFREEYGMEIGVDSLLGAFDHILPEERQHWVSVTYVASHVAGTPTIREPAKCSQIGWFTLDVTPEPMSDLSRRNLVQYIRGASGSGTP